MAVPKWIDNKLRPIIEIDCVFYKHPSPDEAFDSKRRRKGLNVYANISHQTTEQIVTGHIIMIENKQIGKRNLFALVKGVLCNRDNETYWLHLLLLTSATVGILESCRSITVVGSADAWS